MTTATRTRYTSPGAHGAVPAHIAVAEEEEAAAAEPQGEGAAGETG